MQEFIGCYSIWIAYRAVFDKTEYRLVISRLICRDHQSGLSVGIISRDHQPG